MKQIDWDKINKNPEQYEIRVGYYLEPMVTSEQIKMIRFQLEMEQHYREEKDKHDLLIHTLNVYKGLL